MSELKDCRNFQAVIIQSSPIFPDMDIKQEALDNSFANTANTNLHEYEKKEVDNQEHGGDTQEFSDYHLMNLKQEVLDIKEPLVLMPNSDYKECLQPSSGNRTHKCCICGEDYKLKRHLIRHIATHSLEKMFTCHLCKYKTWRESNLERHQMIHREKSYVCTRCEYKATDKLCLKRHVRAHPREKPYACSVCEYKASRKKHLERHIKVHIEKKPYECSVCEYKVKAKCYFERHMRTHTGEKPYACSICEYDSSQKCNLERHIKIHVREKQERMETCNKESPGPQGTVGICKYNGENKKLQISSHTKLWKTKNIKM